MNGRACGAFFVLFTLASFSCARRAMETGPALRSVRGVVVKSSELPNEVSGFGSLSYAKKTDVSSPVEAIVAAIPFREGDSVRAGAVVVRLENPHLGLAVGRSENALSQAQAALDLAVASEREGVFQAEARIRTLEKSGDELALNRRELEESERKQADQERVFAAGGVTEETIRSGRFTTETKRKSVELAAKSLEINRIGLRDEDLEKEGYRLPKTEKERNAALIELSTATLRAQTAAAVSRVDAAKKELESARLSFSELTLSAPISGTVAARYFEIGERVKSEDKILTLIEENSLFAVFAASESDAMSLSKGMKAVVRIDAMNAEFQGKVDVVAPTADSQSASFSVRVRFIDAKKRLKPGMFARVTVCLGVPKKIVTVPDSVFVEKRDSQGRLFVVKDGLISERKVELGAQTIFGREVRRGLWVGEVAVDRPDTALREGDHVIVEE
ncbi:MAG: efflux RND transporter periplasmic adaptor subunit [Treponemataceae bacterium]